MGQVTLKAIHKRYDKLDVIRGIDLEVRDGEFMVFVGPSGCGKSTTLRMIAGLETITEGELLIDGQRANDLHPAQRGAAMVFQSYALYPHMTVAENMAFALKMAGVARKERDLQVGKTADILRITNLLQRYPKELSGGQRQRVAIGRAIVRKPKVFLFDEPLSNLDTELRVNMRIELSRLHQELGTTMIYVTHDQVEAMTMGDRIAVFHQGTIAQLGEPMHLYQRPANEFVAGFLGSPRMNFIRHPAPDSAAAHQALWQWMGGKAPAGASKLGIRPEHIQLSQSDQGVAANVVLTEQLGDTSIVHLRVDGVQDLLVAKIGNCNDRLPAGSAVRLVLDSAATALAFDMHGRILAW